MIDVGKLKSLFIVTEDEKAPEVKTANTVESSSSAPAKVKDSVVRKMVEHLSNILVENNQDGFDYMEFRNAVRELLTNGDSEQKAFTSVYTTAKTIGIGKSDLLKSAKHYITVLEKEKSDFTAEIESRVSQDLAAKKQRLEDVNSELEKLQKEKETLIKEIDDSSTKIEENQSGFQDAWNIIHGKISEDEKKIREFIEDK